MWRYDNVRFIYDNRVDSVHGQKAHFDSVYTYMKSKFALMEALNVMVFESYIGKYVEIDPRSVKYNKPYKV